MARIRGVEDPDVRPPNARCRELRIPCAGNGCQGGIRPLLTSAGGSDEGAIGTAEDDIIRFVADEQRANHMGRRGSNIHDAHAIREMIDDPDFARAANGHRHGLHAHGHRGGKSDSRGRNIENLEAIVGNIRHEKPGPVGRKSHGTNRPTLESDEVGLGLNDSRSREQDRER